MADLDHTALGTDRDHPQHRRRGDEAETGTDQLAPGHAEPRAHD
jgi:hypothetical protein